MWPTIFELDVGESIAIELEGEIFRIQLHSVNHIWEPDYWIVDNDEQRTIKAAKVAVSVNGVDIILHHRPYEMPVSVAGLRLYVETTRLWATSCAIDGLDNIIKEVRFSAQPVGRPWGPEEMRFPITKYRWRAATYHNTWSSLVPYNLFYYHRGEDFGAIPDRLDVIAVYKGSVTSSPVPVAKDSNVVSITSAPTLDNHIFSARYAHMNIETIDSALLPGAWVETGQVLGKTGCTWEGWHSQWADPHLHISFKLGDLQISPYPFLVEAYLRDYPDNILAVAGGYHFAMLGDTVVLDATRTISRDPSTKLHYMWHLHTGELVHEPLAYVRCQQPGQYAEELVVRTNNGHEDRDYAEIRVYDSTSSHTDLAHGWAYSDPVRDITPGSPVLLWNRLLHIYGPVMINVGDGSPVVEMGEEMTHVYTKPGIYTVSMRGQSECGAPVIVKLRVVVG